MNNQTLETTCCIVGGGPAGMMLGYLLARDGVPVTVLEKHADFFRDFRGDTVHPSTLGVMHELGILDEFLKLPHQKLRYASGVYGGYTFTAADFSHLPSYCKFTALMPQWNFLNFLTEQGNRYPNFNVRMQHEAIGLIEEDGKYAGVEVKTPEGTKQVRAHMVVACDGRHSVVRRAAKLPVQEFGVPIDVLWFRISRSSDDPEQLLGNINYGKGLILIPRGDYFQAGLIIRKGSFEDLKKDGIEAFRNGVLQIAPYLGERVQDIREWDQIKLLSVQINRLRQWHRPGLLCIGDAAHAMSPAGGVGINLAIQDAVAAANILGRALRDGAVTQELVAQVQKRREFPTRVIQFVQVRAHRFMDQLFQDKGAYEVPWQLKVASRIPVLRHIIGRAVGLGPRPEHITGRPYAPKNNFPIRAAAFAAGVLAGMTVLRRRLATE